MERNSYGNNDSPPKSNAKNNILKITFLGIDIIFKIKKIELIWYYFFGYSPIYSN